MVATCARLTRRSGSHSRMQAWWKPCRVSLRTRATRQDLALQHTQWVKLASGKSVRVDELGYRPNVAVVLFNDAGKVFTCHRISGRSSKQLNWQYPQGGIDQGEDPQEAAVRELQEETGIANVEVVAEYPGWLRYDFDAHTKARLGARMDRYRGQQQKYFLMRFLGQDSDICFEIPGHVPEFDAFEWVDIDAAPDRVAGFKQHVYKAVADEFGPLIREHIATCPER